MKKNKKLKIYDKIKNRKKKLLALLIDPDKVDDEYLAKFISYGKQKLFDFIFVGGSIVNNSTDELILKIKKELEIPVVLFPGSPSQISYNADALLFLSLISGRNPDYLIGQHVLAAKSIKNSNLEVIPTGYILIQSQTVSSTEYITNTKPIPANKYDIAVSTAIAGELLGMKMIYLEGGSGAKIPIKKHTVLQVKMNIHIPLIVGGGISDPEKARDIAKFGADVIVIGTAIENNVDLIPEFYDALNRKGIYYK